MEEIESHDMECEQICSPAENGQIDLDPLVLIPFMPKTPSHDISGINQFNEDIQPVTPPNICGSSSCSTPIRGDSSFIKRVGIDQLMSRPRAMPRPLVTSTPLMNDGTLSSSLPARAPTRLHSRNKRKCKSVGNVQRSKRDSNGVPYEYINPFTPSGQMLSNKLRAYKRFQRLSLTPAPPKFDLTASSTSSSQSGEPSTKKSEGAKSLDFDIDDIPRKTPLKEFDVTRFYEEYEIIEDLGQGSHGSVQKCVFKMNGMVYAVKRSLMPIRNGNQERMVRNEIYAHGVLDHKHIVRNYSCWKENGYVFLQNEFCNGGNLEEYVKVNRMSEKLLRNLLSQIAEALKYMHSKGLVHMDIKPGNIFLCVPHKDSSSESDRGFSDNDKTDEVLFKLGDLGHVSSLDNDDAEEGDCRYLSRDIIQEEYTNLDKSDIFALGLTVYEVAGGGPLPKNGDEWHELRNGNLKYLDSYSQEFNDILKKMIEPSKEIRPSAEDLVKLLNPTPLSSSPSQDDFSMYIQEYRRNHTRLEHTALATNQYLKVLFKSHRQMQEHLQKGTAAGRKRGAVTKARVVGRKTNRSNSNSAF